MIKWFKEYLTRRRIIKELIEYAKTKEGYEFILAMSDGNLILADYNYQMLGGKCGEVIVRTKIPDSYLEKASMTPSLAMNKPIPVMTDEELRYTIAYCDGEVRRASLWSQKMEQFEDRRLEAIIEQGARVAKSLGR